MVDRQLRDYAVEIVGALFDECGGVVIAVEGDGVEETVALMSAREETVLDGERIIAAPAYKAAGIVIDAVQMATEHGVLDGERRRRGVTHHAADMIVAVRRAINDGLDPAVAHGGDAARPDDAHQSGGMGPARHGARHGKVLDGGAHDVAEGGGALGRCLADVDVERLAVAVEGTREGVRLRADGGSDGIAIIVEGVVEFIALVCIGAGVHVLCEGCPVGSVFNQIGSVDSTAAVESPSSLREGAEQGDGHKNLLFYHLVINFVCFVVAGAGVVYQKNRIPSVIFRRRK